MFDNIINIISQLNKEKSSNFTIELDNTLFKLVCFNKKYYFIAEYNSDYSFIESELIKITKSKIFDTIPNNTYLILLYKINSFNDEISNEIIALEENEFFFKKYVFYYTENEYTSFINWFNSLEDKSCSSILAKENCSPFLNDDNIKFFLRFLIKVPFINFEFEKIKLKSFDDILNAQLNSIRRDKIDVINLNNYLLTCMFDKQPEDIADEIILKALEGLSYENK